MRLVITKIMMIAISLLSTFSAQKRSGSREFFLTYGPANGLMGSYSSRMALAIRSCVLASFFSTLGTFSIGILSFSPRTVFSVLFLIIITKFMAFFRRSISFLSFFMQFPRVGRFGVQGPAVFTHRLMTVAANSLFVEHFKRFRFFTFGTGFHFTPTSFGIK